MLFLGNFGHSFKASACCVLFVGIVLDFTVKSCIGVPLTNAVSRQLDLEQSEQSAEVGSSYWIGSHTLNFTPNPFLIKSRRGRLETSESEVIPMSVDPPSSSTTEIPVKRKGRRRVKGRRRDGKNRKTPVTIRSRRVRGPKIPKTAESDEKDTAQQEVKNDDSKTVNGESLNESQQIVSPPVTTVPVIRTMRPGIVEDVPISTMALDYLSPPNMITSQRPFDPISLVSITTPEPILFDYNDPVHNQIPVDFAKTHPENLNPTYFRNIIVSAMMKRLSKAGLVRHN